MTRLSSSAATTPGLTQCLQALGARDVPVSGQSLAERLGLCFDFSDAVALSAALEKRLVLPEHPEPLEVAPLLAEYAELRARLTGMVQRSCSVDPGIARVSFPVPTVNAQGAPAFEPFARFYLAIQRDIDMAVRQLRMNLRDRLGRMSLPLARLARLDAAFEDTLLLRSARLFGSISRVLETRFRALYATHCEHLGEGEANGPAQWQLPGSWLDVFRKDVQTVLLAELEARLQPVMGLIEAVIEQDKKK